MKWQHLVLSVVNAKMGTRMVISFIVLGAAGAAAYVVLSSILHALGFPTWIASFSSYLTLVPVLYLAQRNITFESRSSHFSSFPKYVVTQIVGLMLSALVPYQVAHSTGDPAFRAFASVAIAVALVNFMLMKFWTFAKDA
jgi:putative flippase GtrA